MTSSKQKVILKYIILEIMSNNWKPHDRLKSRAWFTIHFDIGISSVKKVFKQLISIHIIYIKDKKYFVSDLKKEGILQTNIIQNIEKPKNITVNPNGVITSKQIIKNNRWINLVEKGNNSKYYSYEKIITSKGEIVRKTDIYFPLFLDLNHEFLKDSYLKFLALNGFIIEKKVELTDFVVIKSNGFIRLREIMYGEDKKILKIAIHYIVPEFFEKYTNESLFF